MTWLNLIPKIVGLSVVSALIIRSHLKVDSTKTKRQITKVSIIGLTGLMLLGACAIETPFASAQATALTGYILDTPLPIADWYIGTYGTNNYFAINGSNWDNLMRGVGSTAWAAYATNYTKVEELVLASVTSGSVYLKDVPFDLALMGNIPENVQVECNYQGVTYKYINSASSLGSPYTISVGQGPNAGYYLAQDSGDRICFASTSYKTVHDAVSTVLTVSGGTIVLQPGGTFTSTATLNGYSNVNVVGEKSTLRVNSNTPSVHALTFNNIVNSVWHGVNIERTGVNASNSYVLYAVGATDESVKFLDCNFANLITGSGGTGCHGVSLRDSSASSFSGCTITGGSGGTNCRGVSSGVLLLQALATAQ